MSKEDRKLPVSLHKQVQFIVADARDLHAVPTMILFRHAAGEVP